MIMVTREYDRLFAQATGHPRLEIFAESEKDFFAKVMDAQITFATDDSASATALVLHQNGRDTIATKIAEISTP